MDCWVTTLLFGLQYLRTIDTKTARPYHATVAKNALGFVRGQDVYNQSHYDGWPGARRPLSKPIKVMMAVASAEDTS
ncbi:hypothetical protein NWI01_30370 [Nitrobacter winogradskyi]|uniref:Uncharacterized protein n=1 Tax=Nitrobacter winogradskyi TaxID=913 RepID=A0A4Y3WEQ0_NITWI|nr:hypothetical protein NWI01_30370 [Nitrobacter winogradskyi]